MTCEASGICETVIKYILQQGKQSVGSQGIISIDDYSIGDPNNSTDGHNNTVQGFTLVLSGASSKDIIYKYYFSSQFYR